MHIGYLLENQKERDHQDDQEVGWWIITKQILENRMGWYGLAGYGSG
jgi:hypothetical protein